MNFIRHRRLIETGIWARLSPSGKAVLFSLDYFCNDRTGEGWPSLSRLALASGLSVNGVKAGIKELLHENLFTREDRGPGAKDRPRYLYRRTTPSTVDRVKDTEGTPTPSTVDRVGEDQPRQIVNPNPVKSCSPTPSNRERPYNDELLRGTYKKELVTTNEKRPVHISKLLENFK